MSNGLKTRGELEGLIVDLAAELLKLQGEAVVRQTGVCLEEMNHLVLPEERENLQTEKSDHRIRFRACYFLGKTTRRDFLTVFM